MELFHKYTQVKKTNISSRPGSPEEYDEFDDIKTLKKNYNLEAKSFYEEKKRRICNKHRVK